MLMQTVAARNSILFIFLNIFTLGLGIKPQTGVCRWRHALFKLWGLFVVITFSYHMENGAFVQTAVYAVGIYKIHRDIYFFFSTMSEFCSKGFLSFVGWLPTYVVFQDDPVACLPVCFSSSSVFSGLDKYG